MTESKLHHILEELDSRLADSIDKLEECLQGLDEPTEEVLNAEDIRDLAEQIRGVINE